jgi:hypothetical protein
MLKEYNQRLRSQCSAVRDSEATPGQFLYPFCINIFSIRLLVLRRGDGARERYSRLVGIPL